MTWLNPWFFTDDGWSGTNFDRPNFKRMIDDIELGKINMVIVKDLSRFGREYAQMGMYIEHYFEEKGVRFISVAENIDSKNGIDNLVLPFTNVINSFYARQSSSKTKAAKEARAKSGMFLGSHAPFGYSKDPNDRHHLVIDPPAAEVVQEIFQLFANGRWRHFAAPQRLGNILYSAHRDTGKVHLNESFLHTALTPAITFYDGGFKRDSLQAGHVECYISGGGGKIPVVVTTAAECRSSGETVKGWCHESGKGNHRTVAEGAERC